MKYGVAQNDAVGYQGTQAIPSLIFAFSSTAFSARTVDRTAMAHGLDHDRVDADPIDNPVFTPPC